MIREIIKFYVSCFSRAFRDLISSFGVASPIQSINTALSFIPFLFVAIKGIYEKGIIGFITNFPDKYEDLLFSLLWFFIVLVFNIIRAPYLLKKDVEKRLEELEKSISILNERLQPRLSLEFENSAPFVQITGGLYLFRLRVQNLSEIETLRNVIVKLESISPNQYKYLPLVLHQMHDNPADGMFKQSFDLSPLSNNYIDVINIAIHNQPPIFYISHAVRNLPQEPINIITSFTISVSSDSVRPIKETYNVVINANIISLVRANQVLW